MFDTEHVAGLTDDLFSVPGFMKHLLESIHDGILIADRDAIVRYVNSAYSRITGVRREDIVGKPLRSVRPGARLPDVISSGRDMLGVIRKENNTEYIVDMFPIRANGAVVGGISIVWDITQVKALTRDLERSRMLLDGLRNRLRDVHRAVYTFDDIVGRDGGLAQVVAFARRAAQSDSTIILRGESGTGKELFAQAIHNASRRADGPFVSVNCAAIPSELLESELFGYVKGAFTGAKEGGKAGLFHLASGGTLLLDEVGEMSLSLQAKMLRVLQDRQVRPIGSNDSIRVDVRIISATNRDLERAVEEGAFRRDLYYRLSVLPIVLPPLRERRGDIPDLVNYFLSSIGTRRGERYRVSEEAMSALVDYPWPGNLRELQNALEYAAHLAEGADIHVEHLPPGIRSQGRGARAGADGPAAGPDAGLRPLPGASVASRAGDGPAAPGVAAPAPAAAAAAGAPAAADPAASPGFNLRSEAAQQNRRAIIRALRASGWDVAGKKAAAKMLGISLASLYNRLKEYGITRSDLDGDPS